MPDTIEDVDNRLLAVRERYMRALDDGDDLAAFAAHKQLDDLLDLRCRLPHPR